MLKMCASISCIFKAQILTLWYVEIFLKQASLVLKKSVCYREGVCYKQVNSDKNLQFVPQKMSAVERCQKERKKERNTSV